MPEEARWAGTAVAWCPSSAEGAEGRRQGLLPLWQAPGLLCMVLAVPHEDPGWEEEETNASSVLRELGAQSCLQ